MADRGATPRAARAPPAPSAAAATAPTTATATATAAASTATASGTAHGAGAQPPDKFLDRLRVWVGQPPPGAPGTPSAASIQGLAMPVPTTVLGATSPAQPTVASPPPMAAAAAVAAALLSSPSSSSSPPALPMPAPGAMTASPTASSSHASPAPTAVNDALATPIVPPEPVDVRAALHSIDPALPLAQRVRALRELGELVKTHRLDDIVPLWAAVEPLLEASAPAEARQVAYGFMAELVEGQNEYLSDIQRAHVFAAVAVRAAGSTADLIIRKLTKEGRELAGVGHRLCGLLLNWLTLATVDVARRKAFTKEIGSIFLVLLGMVKFNFALLEESSIVDIIVATCNVCVSASSNDDVYSSLALMDVVVRYGFVPFLCLDVFVQTLCRTVNVERFTQSSWGVVRNLLKSHCAHSTIRTLCQTIEDPKHKESVGLLRGAVFFIGMATWSSQKIANLFHSFASVLPSLLAAVACQLPVVDLEVILSIHRLVRKYGKELSAVEWDIILDMLILWRRYMRERTAADTTVAAISAKYTALIAQIHDFYALDRFAGSAARYFDLLSMLGSQLDEPLTLHLLTYRAEEIHPIAPSWLDDWEALMTTFYEQEGRPQVRFRALSLLSAAYSATRLVSGTALVSLIVIPHLLGPAAAKSANETAAPAAVAQAPLLPAARSRLADEMQADVATLAVELLVQIILSDHDLDEATTERLLQGLIGCVYSPVETTALAAIGGLVRVFETSLLWVSLTLCTGIFDQLLRILGTFGMSVSVRVQVLTALLRLRASDAGRLHVLPTSSLARSRDAAAGDLSPTSPRAPRKADANTSFDVSYSPYVSVQPSTQGSTPIAVIPISAYVSAIVAMLRSVQPFDVMYPFLISFPAQLSNKALFAGADVQIRELLSTLTEGILQGSLSDRVNQWPANSPKKPSDVYIQAFHLLAVMLGYKHLFAKAQHDEIILCFEKGLTKLNNTAKICIHALNICSVELPLSMQKLLPPILVKFSQIASNPLMSVHILEFLSALIQAPELHINFFEMDYKRIFGIALQHITSAAAYAARPPAAAAPTTAAPLPTASSTTAGMAAQPTMRLTETKPGATTAMTVQHAMYIRDLAHRVLCVWFMGLRVSDRRKYVPFITKGLLNAFEPYRNVAFMAEQTELILEMLARHTFAACQSKPARSYAAERLMENAPSRYWAYGSCILQIATTSAGWSELTLRRPSGTTAWLCRLQNRATVPQESDFLSLPATLMMHVHAGPAHDTDDFVMVTSSQPDEQAAIDDDSRPRSSSASMGGQQAEAFPEFPATTPAVDVPGKFVSDLQEVEAPSGSMEDLAKDMADKARMRSKTYSGAAMAAATASRRKSSPHIDAGAAGKPLRELLSAATALSEPSMDRKSAGAANTAVARSTTATARDAYAMPSFQFLQMIMYPGAVTVVPLPLRDGEPTVRAIKNLDRIPAVDFHKIGVVYVGPGQMSEADILGNSFGSPRYTQFLSALGKLLRLKDCTDVYTGGLDTENDTDGEFSYYWQDDITQMIFHVATLMPSEEWFMKKRHIGNDYVTIVYNDSSTEYTFGTLASQFDFVNIVLRPLDEDTVQVSMLTKTDLPDFSPLVTPKVVSTSSAPIFVRQVALHANHMSHLHSHVEYMSNFTSRLRQIRRIGERFCETRGADAAPADQQRKAQPPETSLSQPVAHITIVPETADFTVYA